MYHVHNSGTWGLTWLGELIRRDEIGQPLGTILGRMKFGWMSDPEDVYLGVSIDNWMGKGLQVHINRHRCQPPFRIVIQTKARIKHVGNYT
jgi:hypothetical protein